MVDVLGAKDDGVGVLRVVVDSATVHNMVSLATTGGAQVGRV